MASKTRIEMVEVGPRDGLQNEKAVVSTADKAELIRRAIAYGARRIEVTSFVNPSRVPQLADAEQLVAMLPDRDDVTYIGLVLNRRGAERALATGRIDELGAVCVTSDAFGIRNQGQSSDESLAAAIEIIELAHAAGAQVVLDNVFATPILQQGFPLGADVGVATTGVAGPASDSRGTPVGTVFIAVSTPQAKAVVPLRLSGDRGAVRRGSTREALELAIRVVQEGYPERR